MRWATPAALRAEAGADPTRFTPWFLQEMEARAWFEGGTGGSGAGGGGQGESGGGGQ